MNWAEAATAVMDAMTGTGIRTSRQVIGPGPTVGRRCSQFTVHPDLIYPLTPFSALPAKACAVVPIIGLRAIYTKDCAPTPGDHGEQPDAAKTTAWTVEYLAECESLYGAILDAFRTDCDGITVGQATFAGPSGGLANMSVPIALANLTGT